MTCSLSPTHPPRIRMKTMCRICRPIKDYPANFRELLCDVVSRTPEERAALFQKILLAKPRPALIATGDWCDERMASAKHPIQGKSSRFFWHGHFTTSARRRAGVEADVGPERNASHSTRAGNFGSCQSISRDPAMLDYLNNQQNSAAGHPNAN